MNRENVQATINILKRAQVFDICCVQNTLDDETTTIAMDEAQLHACGNSACIAGHVAVSPEWRAVGGEVLPSSGVPVHLATGNTTPTDAMAFFWGIHRTVVEAIVYGGGFRSMCSDLSIEGMPLSWSYMTRDQAVSLFEQLLELDANGVSL